MRISDWSSDVCASDLTLELHRRRPLVTRQDDQRGLPRQGREGTVRCHFTIGAANIEVCEILRHLAELLVRLEVDPLGAAPIEEIVDVGTAPGPRDFRVDRT